MRCPLLLGKIIVVAAFFMSASGMLLFMAQKEISMGTAYAIWVGLGAAGTFLISVLVYNDCSGQKYFTTTL